MAKVVIVIPTYNERKSTEKMIEALAIELPKIKRHRIEVLYVDDTSPDGTYKIIQAKAKKYFWLHILLNKEKKGLGVAYAKGFKHAMNELKADYIMEFDGDFQHKPEEIGKLVEKIDEGYEYIIGSRYIPGGSIPKEWSFKRKFLSVIGNYVARIGLLLPKVHDLTTGFKLTKVKGVLEKIDLDHLYSNTFAYKMQIGGQIIQGRAKWVEVPITFMARTQGESKIIKNEMFETLKVIFLVQIHNSKIQRFLKFGTVGFMGYLVNAIFLEVFSRTVFVKLFATKFIFLQGTLLTFLTEGSAWAAALAAELAIINNFVFNNLWTFKEVKIKNPFNLFRKFIEFNFASLGAVIIQFVVVGVVVAFFSDTRLVRQVAILISMPLVLSFNYVMYNLFIWKTWNLPRKRA